MMSVVLYKETREKGQGKQAIHLELGLLKAR
jgi:hypothetical protein